MSTRAQVTPLPVPQARSATKRAPGRAWFGVNTAWLARYATASSAVIGAAIRLHGACAALINGGRFPGAHHWTDKQWLLTAQLDRDEVNAVADAGLAVWEGFDLVLLDYDAEREEIYLRQHRQAANASEAAAEARRRRSKGGP